MTLAEALRRVSTLNGKLETLREQFMSELTVTVVSDMADPSELPGKPEVTLEQMKALQHEIGQLKLRIQLTNMNARVVYDGSNCTLAELLLLLNDLKAQLRLRRILCKDVIQADRYGFNVMEGREVLLDYDVDSNREERDRLIEEIAQLDLFVQQTNYNTQLAE